MMKSMSSEQYAEYLNNIKDDGDFTTHVLGLMFALASTDIDRLVRVLTSLKESGFGSIVGRSADLIKSAHRSMVEFKELNDRYLASFDEERSSLN